MGCLSESPEHGVGQNARHPGCFLMLGAVWFAFAVGVGQAEDEDSLPSMRGADFLRRVHAERTSEAKYLQVCKHITETECEVSRHILEKHSSGPNSVKVSGNDRPQVSAIVRPSSLTSGGKGLAGIASAVPIDSRKSGKLEVGQITAPDRTSVQPPRLHLAAQDRATEGFPLHHADRASASANGSKSGVQSEVESADSGADAENVIHTMVPPGCCAVR